MLGTLNALCDLTLRGFIIVPTLSVKELSQQG